MAKPDAIIATTPENIRLDCLRLAHRHDFMPADIIERARAFEAYVTGTATSSKPEAASKKPQKDNPLS